LESRPKWLPDAKRWVRSAAGYFEVMSGENVEIVRRAYEALNNREFSRIDEFLDPEAEIDISRNALNPGIYRGHSGFERMIRATDDVWGGFRSEVQEVVDVGDRVVVGVRSSATGGASGVTTKMDLFHLFTLRDRRIVQIVGGFRSKADALEAAGLSE
jgi:ketosteroid isomerase-like protein